MLAWLAWWGVWVGAMARPRVNNQQLCESFLLPLVPAVI